MPSATTLKPQRRRSGLSASTWPEFGPKPTQSNKEWPCFPAPTQLSTANLTPPLSPVLATVGIVCRGLYRRRFPQARPSSCHSDVLTACVSQLHPSHRSCTSRIFSTTSGRVRRFTVDSALAELGTWQRCAVRRRVLCIPRNIVLLANEVRHRRRPYDAGCFFSTVLMYICIGVDVCFHSSAIASGPLVADRGRRRGHCPRSRVGDTHTATRSVATTVAAPTAPALTASLSPPRPPRAPPATPACRAGGWSARRRRFAPSLPVRVTDGSVSGWGRWPHAHVSATLTVQRHAHQGVGENPVFSTMANMSSVSARPSTCRPWNRVGRTAPRSRGAPVVRGRVQDRQAVAKPQRAGSERPSHGESDSAPCCMTVESSSSGHTAGTSDVGSASV